TSVIGGYARINYNDTAKGFLCNPNGAAVQVVFGAFGAGSALNCNPNFALASVSTRTAWNPHPFLEIGLDLIWQHVDTGFAGSTRVRRSPRRAIGAGSAPCRALKGRKPAKLLHDDALQKEYPPLFVVLCFATQTPGGRPRGFGFKNPPPIHPFSLGVPSPSK